MSSQDTAGARPVAPFRWLEQATALVLILVLAALAGVVLAAYQPDWTAAASELLIVSVVVLLTAALGMVSLVALLHTRA
jgi:hypothetical protein